MTGRVGGASSESDKDRIDRQFAKLLAELRVVLPDPLVVLAFLFTVPFATRFGKVNRGAYAAGRATSGNSSRTP